MITITLNKHCYNDWAKGFGRNILDLDRDEYMNGNLGLIRLMHVD